MHASEDNVFTILWSAKRINEGHHLLVVDIHIIPLDFIVQVCGDLPLNPDDPR